MIISIFNFTLAIVLPALVFTIAWILSARSSSDRENSSPFECGFDPNNNARVPFSTRFFLLAVIFLVFDIEIALLMPIPIILSFNINTLAILNSLIFFFILLAGLLHEWREGSLNWSL